MRLLIQLKPSFKPQRIISKFQSNSLIQCNLLLLLLSRSVFTGNFGKRWQNLVLKTLLSTLCIAPIATDSGCFLLRCNKQKELHMSHVSFKTERPSPAEHFHVEPAGKPDLLLSARIPLHLGSKSPCYWAMWSIQC